MTAPPRTSTPHRRLIGWSDAALFAALTAVPLALGGRGRLNADTKQYLYLDPGDLLARARHLWDPALGGGTVSHQAIGYLWPMGPYYWLADRVGLPDWLAQRLWIGGIQLVAALGVLALLRHLMPRHPAQLVGAALYGLSPFVLGHVTGQSGLLLAFSALGWMVLCVALALERGGWRWPAAFALVVTTCGSLNGSSVFFVVLGAVLWLPHAVFVTRRATPRAGAVVLAKLGGLTVVTQLWWLAAYAVGGSYGLPILAVTENVQTTTGTTSAIEVLRGLGYWFFYGRDKLGPWLAGLAPPYLTATLIAVTVAVPVLALSLGAVVRWAHRAYFAGLVAVGTVVAVAAFPEPRSPAGSVFERLSRHSDLVLSLRNTQRAAPLVILGLAGLVAAGGSALQRRHARAGAALLAAMSAAVAASLPAQWRTGLIADRFHREAVPQAWRDAGERLDRRGEGRVLELPGIDFASYRWGHTLDPVLTGLTQRDVLFRELVPAGGLAGASLLAALDAALQEYRLEPAMVAPVARLLGVSDVVFRGDLEYERYRTVRPEVAWSVLTDPAAGLGEPQRFGPGYPNEAAPNRPMIDEIELGLPPSTDEPPQVGILGVPEGGRPRLSSAPTGPATVLAGDGEGVLAAAGAGLIGRPTDGPLLLAGTIDGLPGTATAAGTRYVVTDSNRKRAGRWYSLRENVGATEPADAPVVLEDPSDARLDVTAGRDEGERTVARWVGAKRIWANSYGNPFTLLPEDRPVNAFDGDPRTAWRVEVTRDSGPARIGITLDQPSRAGRVRLVPVTGRPGTTTPVQVRVVLDGRRRFTASAGRDGELTVDLDGRPFSELSLQVLRRSAGDGPVGIAEIEIPGVRVREVIHLPTATLSALGSATGEAPLAIVASRERSDPAEVVRFDPEPAIARSFDLAGPASFTVRGTARLDPRAGDDVVDRVLGFPGAAEGGFTATSSEHLAGDLAARASAAFDGDPSTAWTTPFVGLVGQGVDVDAGRPTTLDRLAVDLVLDRRHSTPTALRVSSDGGEPLTVELPPGDAHPRVELPRPLTGRRFRFEIAAVRERTVVDWYSERPVALPVAVTDIAVPGLPGRPPAAALHGGCRDDLLSVDGRAVPLRLAGSAPAAATGRGVDLVACGEPLALPAGRHEIVATPGRDTAIDLDRLVLTTPAWDTAASPASAPPAVAVRSASATAASATVRAAREPFWLVLDQSMNEGWDLSVDGADVDGPYPVDSFAAGWLVSPRRPGDLEVDVRWTPERTVDAALAVSGIGVLACVALVVAGGRRRRGPAPEEPRLAVAAGSGGRDGVALVVAAAVGGAVLVAPLAAIPAAAVAAVVVWWPAVGRALPAFGVAAAGVMVAVDQAANDHPLDGEWPRRFGPAHVVAMLAVLALGVGVALDARLARGEHVED